MLRPRDGSGADRDHRAGGVIHAQQFEREHGADDVDHRVHAARFVEVRLRGLVG